MRIIVVCLLVINLSCGLTAQVEINRNDTIIDNSLLLLEDSLQVLGEIIITDSLLPSRLHANQLFCQLWEQALGKTGAFAYPFDSLQTVSKLNAPDGSFKMFTWQLFETSDLYTYHGYILHKDGRVVRLQDQSADYFTPEFETGDKDHWYGALYYNLVPFVGTEQQTQYLLFGFDGNSLMERRKIIDVLTLSEDGLPTFGAPVFIASEDSRAHPPVLNRIVLEYFADAAIKCNFDELQNQILYDHLIFKTTPYGEFMIPDGSYEGYIYTEGKWKHNVKVFYETLAEPPFPKPVLNNGRKKDLFGNDSNNKPRPARKKSKKN